MNLIRRFLNCFPSTQSLGTTFNHLISVRQTVNGKMSLSLDPGNWGNGQLMDGSPNQPNTVSAGVKRLDELEELASSPVGLIKIDVVGA